MPFLVLARKASQEGCREDRNSGPGGGKQVENINWKPQESLSERELGGESVATAETSCGGGYTSWPPAEVGAWVCQTLLL